MQFIGPRNRPRRSETISRYGLAVTSAGGYTPPIGEDTFIQDEIVRGFFWTMGAAAGASLLAIGSKLALGK
tara:strand:+ start:387 stop:599 length:213 start_codon:yes stop_codon:yes gene_type:complete